jgi:hypothetical protein
MTFVSPALLGGIEVEVVADDAVAPPIERYRLRTPRGTMDVRTLADVRAHARTIASETHAIEYANLLHDLRIEELRWWGQPVLRDPQGQVLGVSPSAVSELGARLEVVVSRDPDRYRIRRPVLERRECAPGRVPVALVEETVSPAGQYTIRKVKDLGEIRRPFDVNGK